MKEAKMTTIMTSPVKIKVDVPTFVAVYDSQTKPNAVHDKPRSLPKETSFPPIKMDEPIVEISRDFSVEPTIKLK